MVTAVSFGVDEAALKLIKSSLPQVKIQEFPLDLQAMLKPQLDVEPDLIFCGQYDAKINLVEIAQGVHSMFSNIPIYFVTSTRTGFDRAAIGKAGFTDAFLMPMDQAVLRDLVSENSSEFKDVPLVDITPGTVLDFDTYILLPVNRKYIRFSSAGYPLAKERVERLIKHHIATVQIARSDLKKFYDFTAAQLKKLSSSQALSEIERRERLHSAVRSLFTGLLTETSELQDCTAIVKAYILSADESTSSLYEKVLRLGGSGHNGLTHVSNVSTLAAMIAIAIMPDAVEDMALAGLLHDVGMAEVPLEVQFKKEGERTAEESALYQRHTIRSIELLRARQFNIPDRVLKTIEQHHERFDGSGFPTKLKEGQIAAEAQLLAFADEFDYLTTAEPGKKRPSPREALDILIASPGFDPVLTASISALF